MATNRTGFCAQIWSTRQFGLGQEVACWFQCWKNSTVSSDQSNNAGIIDVKMNRSVLEEKPSFKTRRLTSSSKLDSGSYSISIAKTTYKKIGALICSMKFHSPEVALYPYNLPYGHAWNAVIMSELMLPVSSWNCWISYKNGYTGQLVFHFLSLLNLWLSV